MLFVLSKLGLHLWSSGWDVSFHGGGVLVFLAGFAMWEFSRRRIEALTGEDRPILLHLMVSGVLAAPIVGVSFYLLWLRAEV